MTTTIMKDSVVGDAWIQQCVQMNPIAPVLDPQTQQPTGNFTTGPVRLSFPDLFKPGKPMNSDDPQAVGKYGASIVFPPGVDFSVLYAEYYRQAGAEFAEYYNGQQYVGIHSPFRDQAEKPNLAGYTPGCVFMSISSQYKPSIVDSRMNPIADESQIYPGVWVIASVNSYCFGKNPPRPKRGVAFGLQSVMKIGDDTQLGGGAVDPASQFGAANVTPPAAQPGAMFGQPTSAPADPMLPGQTPPAGPVPLATPPAPGAGMPAAQPQSAPAGTQTLPPSAAAPAGPAQNTAYPSSGPLGSQPGFTHPLPQQEPPALTPGAPAHTGLPGLGTPAADVPATPTAYPTEPCIYCGHMNPQGSSHCGSCGQALL